jgi:hypothetical protein
VCSCREVYCKSAKDGLLHFEARNILIIIWRDEAEEELLRYEDILKKNLDLGIAYRLETMRGRAATI